MTTALGPGCFCQERPAGALRRLSSVRLLQTVPHAAPALSVAHSKPRAGALPAWLPRLGTPFRAPRGLSAWGATAISPHAAPVPAGVPEITIPDKL